jgi:hypothetical protein
MAEWSEDHVATIDSLNSKPWLVGLWLNWRPDGALRWKEDIIGWEGQGVICGKPVSPRL